jgi:hypothetical protein
MGGEILLGNDHARLPLNVIYLAIGLRAIWRLRTGPGRRPSQSRQDQPIAKLNAQQVLLIRLHAEEGDDISGDAFREERLRMQTEIAAAETSLAETEQRLQLDADMLRVALGLAEDVARVYATASEQTRRGYNPSLLLKA